MNLKIQEKQLPLKLILLGFEQKLNLRINMMPTVKGQKYITQVKIKTKIQINILELIMEHGITDSQKQISTNICTTRVQVYQQLFSLV